jgi:hypothetical protein
MTPGAALEIAVMVLTAPRADCRAIATLVIFVTVDILIPQVIKKPAYTGCKKDFVRVA